MRRDYCSVFLAGVMIILSMRRLGLLDLKEAVEENLLSHHFFLVLGQHLTGQLTHHISYELFVNNPLCILAPLMAGHYIHMTYRPY